MDIPYAFHKNLILRSPAFPFVACLPENVMEDLLQNSFFLEAIYLASPVLYDESIKLKNGQIKSPKEIHKIKIALTKYYKRMYSRCTPFGLFSGCAFMQWGEGETNIQFGKNAFLRSTRLDMHFLCALAQKLALMPEIKNRLCYFNNTSIYKIGDEIRYVEYKYVKGKREHQITSVANTDYLSLLLTHAEKGISIDTMVTLLVEQMDVSTEEAMAFIDELIESQVLISELEPAITGDEFLQQLLKTLRKINRSESAEINGIIQALQAIEKKMQELDERKHNAVQHYRELIKHISLLNIPFEENKLFQTDLFHQPVKNFIASKFQTPLLQVFSFLNSLNETRQNEKLKEFAKKFYERYEEKKMPLLQVLDVDSGIGYGNRYGKNTSPLIENLILPQGDDTENVSISWNKKQKWLLKKLTDAVKNNLFETAITDEDVAQFSAQWNNVPPSVSVLFRLMNEDTIVLENIGGSSAANLLGRFAHGDKAIEELVNAVTDQEDKQNDDIAFAEIVHLPESRIGNILLHPAFRQYEIPFLAKSSLPVDQQIELSDLFISVKNGYIKLFSKKLNKEIIPRLSTAHNFSFKALPVYYFLCDLQTQKMQSGFMFNWGSLAKQFSFLPRVTYQKVILFEATWQLSKTDFSFILDKNAENIKRFVSQWRLPRYVQLADGDNELLVDFENKSSVEVFCQTIKNRDAIVLKEFLFDRSVLVKGADEDFFINQFIAPLVKNESVYKGKRIKTDQKKIRRNFSPGSEWLYYKLYCGEKSADKILTELVRPFVEGLLQKKIIDKWFFIRYTDPNFHLRIRIHFSDKKDMGDLMRNFSERIESFEKEGIIWKMQLDSYQRELERYDPEGMEFAEHLFFNDSMQMLSFLQNIDGDERENKRWPFALKVVDELLNAFHFSLQQKCALMKQLKESFAKEFKADKMLFQQINKKYTANRPLVQQFMQKSGGADLSMRIFDKIIEKAAPALHKTADEILLAVQNNKIHVPMQDLAASHIHMSLNRIFIADARVHEMIIYDFLFQYYYGALRKEGAKLPISFQ